jgi:hypothetical protein
MAVRKRPDILSDWLTLLLRIREVKTTSFHIVSNSLLFIDHPIIQRYTVWTTDSVIKQLNKYNTPARKVYQHVHYDLVNMIQKQHSITSPSQISSQDTRDLQSWYDKAYVGLVGQRIKSWLLWKHFHEWWICVPSSEDLVTFLLQIRQRVFWFCNFSQFQEMKCQCHGRTHVVTAECGVLILQPVGS